MDYKACGHCKESKPPSEFNSKGKNKLQSWCKLCMRVRIRGYYRQNKQYYLDRNAVNKGKVRKELAALKEKPCADCGVSYPYYVMDYDHRDAAEKRANVATLIGTGRRTRALEEIEKCDLVCANCHRIRTHKRRHGLEIGE